MREQSPALCPNPGRNDPRSSDTCLRSERGAGTIGVLSAPAGDERRRREEGWRGRPITEWCFAGCIVNRSSHFPSNVSGDPTIVVGRMSIGHKHTWSDAVHWYLHRRQGFFFNSFNGNFQWCWKWAEEQLIRVLGWCGSRSGSRTVFFPIQYVLGGIFHSRDS